MLRQRGNPSDSDDDEPDYVPGKSHYIYISSDDEEDDEEKSAMVSKAESRKMRKRKSTKKKESKQRAKRERRSYIPYCPNPNLRSSSSSAANNNVSVTVPIGSLQMNINGGNLNTTSSGLNPSSSNPNLGPTEFGDSFDRWYLSLLVAALTPSSSSNVQSQHNVITPWTSSSSSGILPVMPNHHPSSSMGRPLSAFRPWNLNPFPNQPHSPYSVPGLTSSQHNVIRSWTPSSSSGILPTMPSHQFSSSLQRQLSQNVRGLDLNSPASYYNNAEEEDEDEEAEGARDFDLIKPPNE